MILDRQAVLPSRRRLRMPVHQGFWVGAVASLLAFGSVLAAAPAAPASQSALPTVSVQASHAAPAAAYEGTVEAVRQAVLAAQVPGAVVQLDVKAGDRVRAGQVLLRIDARAANQNASAADAQVAAARASLQVAAQDVARKRQLFQKNYISQAALEQAEASYRAAQAQVNVQASQASAARTQSGFYAVQAPFDGVVSAVSVERGDMAMPGRALLTVYDTAALRVSAAVPGTLVARGAPPVRVELAGQAPVTPTRVQVLPTVDAQSLTQQLRADLPSGLPGVVPGQFARLWLAGADAAATGAPARLYVPQSVVLRRAEVTAVYVLDPQGKPLLRQVRLGPVVGDRVEVLAGLDAGERVVATPQQASGAAHAR